MEKLKDRRFKVWVGGEIERTTNWKGVLKLLRDWSDWPLYTASERLRSMNEWRNQRYVYVDANITCTF